MHYIGALRYNINHSVYLFQVRISSGSFEEACYFNTVIHSILPRLEEFVCMFLLSLLSCWELQGQLCSSTKSQRVQRGFPWLKTLINCFFLKLYQKFNILRVLGQ